MSHGGVGTVGDEFSLPVGSLEDAEVPLLLRARQFRPEQEGVELSSAPHPQRHCNLSASLQTIRRKREERTLDGLSGSVAGGTGGELVDAIGLLGLVEVSEAGGMVVGSVGDGVAVGSTAAVAQREGGKKRKKGEEGEEHSSNLVFCCLLPNGTAILGLETFLSV